MTGENSKTLPLDDLHKAAGARFGEFAGWSMPLTYPAGVMKEHLHTRDHVGMFDISHMKLFEIAGRDAAELISRCCPLEAATLEKSQSKYTFFLNETAGIIDDLIVTRLGPERFMIVANAGNANTDEAHLRAMAKDLDAVISPLDRVFLAIQGPEAAAVLSRAGIETSALTFMHGGEPRPNWFMSRSGYTGEDGFEIALPEPDARELAEALLSDERVMWIGLAARDSLRLEAGLCLHGQDITTNDNPVSAGLMWAIPKQLRTDGGFVGASALSEILKTAPARNASDLKPEGRQPVRAGTLLTDADGANVGRVTSGGFGPSVGHPVAMGYVKTEDAKPGAKLFADVRGTKIPVGIHPLPFTPHRYLKG